MRHLAVALSALALLACRDPAPPTDATKAAAPAECTVPPAAAVVPHRSLEVTDLATLGARDFSLRRVLRVLIAQRMPERAGPALEATVQATFLSLVAPPRALSGAAPRALLDEYRPIALVNRLELTPSNGRHCGRFDIVYARGGDALVFEAVLPNPRPGCGVIACRPVQLAWDALTRTAAPAERAAALETFFFSGLSGFRPAIHLHHFRGDRAGGYPNSSGEVRVHQGAVQRELLLAHATTATPTFTATVAASGHHALTSTRTFTFTATVAGPDGPSFELGPLRVGETMAQRKRIMNLYLDNTACEPCPPGPDVKPEEVVREALPRDAQAPIEGLILLGRDTDVPLQGNARVH